MLDVFDNLRDLTFISVLIRLVLSFISGGLIGLEREFKRRPAGFRTHILICLGSSITTLTSQYIILGLNQYADPARLGAQVVSGIGFICAGAILITHRERVKGLTTAAGLWVTAIIGLAIGAGYFEAGLIVTAVVLFIEILLSKLEYRIIDFPSQNTLYIEYKNKKNIHDILQYLRKNDVKVQNIEITRQGESEQRFSCAIMSVRLDKKIFLEKVVEGIQTIEGITKVEQL